MGKHIIDDEYWWESKIFELTLDSGKKADVYAECQVHAMGYCIDRTTESPEEGECEYEAKIATLYVADYLGDFQPYEPTEGEMARATDIILDQLYD